MKILAIIILLLPNIVVGQKMLNRGPLHTGATATGGLSKIWTRYNTVIKPNGMNDQGNVFEPTVIFDNNPQILTAYDSVFKMVYTAGWSSAVLYYAESTDGMNWTNGVSTGLGYARSYWLKVGSTYYLYASNGSSIFCWTSTTGGTNWTIQNSGAPVVVGGQSGSWSSSLHNSAVYIENGTWYMYVEAGQGLSDYKMGVFTSSNGITWSNGPNNPVISGNEGGLSRYNSGGPYVTKLGATYYMWAHTTSTIIPIPTDASRYKSSSLTSGWAVDVPLTLIRKTPDEGPTGAGQIADMSLIQYRGRVFLYYAASGDGNNSVGAQHIKLAIFPGTFADLVASQEGDGL